MEEKSGFGYFLLGLGIGVAAGVLWAPRTGEETRQLIADKAGEGADYIKTRTQEGTEYVRQRAQEGTEYVRQRTDDLKQSAADLYDKGRSTVAQQKDTLNAAVEAGKQAYRDALSDVKSAPTPTSTPTGNA
ncbi:MAG: YtxH domain-containing protein [Bryobacteraceae bacterium]